MAPDAILARTVDGPLFEARDLRKNYGGIQALQGTTVSVQPGAVGLLGPNGAGKTTLIKILLGLVRVTSGEARVLGLDPAVDARAIRRRVGYVPERDAYVPDMSGARYVAYCGELSGMAPRAAKTRAHEVLDYVRLTEARYRDTQTYSTGMRQRLKIAQALVHDPALVILDEPTNGLDPEGRDEILRLCRELARDHGISLVFSSHLLPDVEAVCDQVVILGKGRVVEQGRLADLQTPAAWVDAELRGPVEPLLAALAATGWRHEGLEPGRFRLFPAAGGETGPLFVAAAQHAVEVRRLAQGRTSLEEIFQRAVRGPVAVPGPAAGLAT